MLRKKSQIGQVFIYILAIIIISLLLLFGYRAIRRIVITGEDVAFTQFKTSLEADVKKMATRYGSSQVFNYEVPSEYSMVCFVSDDKIEAKQNIGYDAIMRGSVSAGTMKNVFLITTRTDKSIYAGKLKVADPGFICFNATQGRISIRLEGTGRETLVKEK